MGNANRFLSSLTSSSRTWAMQEGKLGKSLAAGQSDVREEVEVLLSLAPSSLDLEPAGLIPVLKAPGPVEQPSPTALGLLTAPSSPPPKARTADCSFLQIFNTSLQVTPRGFTKPYWFSLSLPHTFVNSAFINSISVCSLSLPRTLTKIICKCICPSGMQMWVYSTHFFAPRFFHLQYTLGFLLCSYTLYILYINPPC